MVDMGYAKPIYIPEEQGDGFYGNSIVTSKSGEYIEELRQAIKKVNKKYGKKT